jgi:hypothetical protein
MHPPISSIIEEFEKKFEDKGDERYGLVKHNNTVLQHQIDFLRSSLTSYTEGLVKELEGMKKIEGLSGYSEKEIEQVKNYNAALTQAINLLHKP